jgi:hypothetical protein
MQSTKSTIQYSQLNLETNPDVRDILIVLKKSPSLKWKIFHGIHTMLGGIFLIAGSSMYFAEIIRHYSMALTAGGCFFTIGSFFLLLADLQEWWYNRYGCCSSQRYRDVYEVSLDNQFQDSNSSIVDRSKRTATELNSFIAACGSACYVVGSALLIPIFEKYVTLGNWLILVGSVLIFLSSIWKIYRTENIFNDISSLIVNIFVGLGGVFYFLSIIYILGFTMNDFGMNLSATFCVTGGTSFLFASFFLQFRYYSRE